MVEITLRRIKDCWNPANKKNDSRDFCLCVLPDCYSSDLCQGESYCFVGDEHNEKRIPDPTVNGILRGNRKSMKDGTSPAMSFTNQFIRGLQEDKPLEYRNKPNRFDPNQDDEKVTFRRNMFEKILSHVTATGSPASKDHDLFRNNNFSTVTFGEMPMLSEERKKEISATYAKVEQAVERLLNDPNHVTVSYAIFLLVVTAIVQDRMDEVEFLYRPDSLDRVFEYTGGPRLVETPSRKQIPFYDKNYFLPEPYHIYLFREPTGALWESGTLHMELLPSGNPAATLTIRTRMRPNAAGITEIKRTYRGKPMLSVVDNTVYIAMTDEKETLIVLMIPHKAFKFAPMYFRSGLLMYTSSANSCPTVQKVAITADSIEEKDLPYVKGFLKLDSDRIILSEEQLKRFKTQFKRYSWMADFEENYEPMFEFHRVTSSMYIFNSEEILACSRSRLCREDRLRILLALKSVDATSDSDLYKFIQCTVPDGTNSIFRYGAATDAEVMCEIPD